MRESTRHCWLALLMLASVSGSIAPAAERVTDDATHDLTAVLLTAGRLDDAEWVCRNELKRHPEGQLGYAKWTARLANVLAQQNSRQVFGGGETRLHERVDPAIDLSCAPIDALLTAYPDSPSAVFLSASKLLVRQHILRAAIIAASVSPPDPSLVDELLSRITRLQGDAAEVHESAVDHWRLRSADLTSRSAPAGQIGADQYVRLIQELALQRVTLAVLQTELFAKNSVDYRAAAADAVSRAEQTILELSDESDAKLAARALLTESLLRSGEIARADEMIQRFGSLADSKQSPTWIALKVRLELARGDTSAARSLCDSFYQSHNSSASNPGSLEMDFAKLDVLLADSQSDTQVAEWIESIERRGGAFARRRAEAIAISKLRTESSDGSKTPATTTPEQRMVPSLIAAQGEDWLRRNDPHRAATLLREAALAEPRPEVALGYAAKCAAASLVAKESAAAIDVLRQTARRHASASDAHQYAMQAALLASKPFERDDDPAERLALLEDILSEISQTWPTGETAVKANAWLCKIFADSGRFEDAAQASLELLTLGKRTDQFAPTLTRWFIYLSQLDVSQATEALESLTSTLRELARESDGLAALIAEASTWLFDRRSLDAQAAMPDGSNASATFLDQLAAFRRSGTGSIETDGVEGELLRRARWRLERDAMLDTSVQRAIGDVLSAWPNADPWQSATSEFWKRQDPSSIEAIVRLAQSDEQRDSAMRRGMRLLSTSVSADAKRAAIELSDRLAAKMKIGTDQWYSVKLQAIAWLKQIGDHEQASKRARYVLLLHKPEDSEVRKQFESYVQ